MTEMIDYLTGYSLMFNKADYIVTNTQIFIVVWYVYYFADREGCGEKWGNNKRFC